MDKKVMDLRAANWVSIFEAQAKSGLSKHNFCKQNGIPETAFFKWQRKLRNQLIEQHESSQATKASESGADYANTKTPTFFELTPAGSSTLAKHAEDDSLEYDYPPEINIPPSVSISYDRFNIRLSGSITPSALSAVLKAVKNA